MKAIQSYSNSSKKTLKLFYPIIKYSYHDNKILISVSFAALIQTLKSHPESVKLIYNISRAKDGEQYKDDNDNNNVTIYLESNNDKLLHLAEKNYENLVKGLTNNAIATPDAPLLRPISHPHCHLPHLCFQVHRMKAISIR